MKSVEEIYREMLDCFAQRTGMRPAEGCDLAARLYAVAAQVYSLYVQAEWLGRQVLPQTAEGSFWTATPSCGALPGRRPPRRRG